MTVTASDIITDDVIRDRVEEVLAESGIYDPRVDRYSKRNGEEVYRIDAAGYVVEVEVQDDIDEFTVELDKKLRNLTMSAAPKAHVGGHTVRISKDDRGLVAKCNECGVKLSMDQDRYKRMTPEQQKQAKRWAIGFFAEN